MYYRIMNTKNELLDELCDIAGDEYKDAFLSVLSKYSFYKEKEAAKEDIQAWVDKFIVAKQIDGCAGRTLHSYKYNLTRFATYIEKRITKVSTDDIRDYIGYLANTRKLKTSSLQLHIGTLRTFFGWIHAEGVIKRNPMARIKSLKIDKRSLRHSLTNEQLERVRDSCETYREKAIIEFFVSTGCRLGEVAGLQLDDVNLEQRSATVIGKGSKRRTVYFSSRSKLMVEMYLHQRRGGSALFSSIKAPYPPLEASAIRRIIKIIGKRAGLSFNLHPHLLRHTFASQAINAGMEITAIQRLLGHEDVSTTQIYAELNESEVRHAHDKYCA